MSNFGNSEIEFNSLLVKYLNNFNLIEANVGLCISYLSEKDRSTIYKKLAYLSFEKKIEYLYKLIKAKKVVASGEELVELEDWCRKAHDARHERNRYIHGIWSFLPHLENGVEVNITPWAKSKYGVSHKNRMSLNDLRGIVKRMWACHTEFLAIRDKYRI